MRLRQVALVASDLQAAKEVLFKVLGLETDFADEGVGEFGLRNSVMALGDTFLEVVSPMQADTTAGRLLSRRDGDGGYMVLFQVEDIQDLDQRMEALNIRKIWGVEREEVKAFHVHPKDIGGAIVSFDQMMPASDWVWGGPNWRQQQARNVTEIIGCELQATDPEALAENWSRACDQRLKFDGSCYRMKLDNGGEITFVESTDGRGEGLSAVTFSSSFPERVKAALSALHLSLVDNEVEMCGTRLRFRFKA